MQNVHLHRFHPIEIALENVKRDEMAGHVNEQSSPPKTRLVFDRDRWDSKSAGRDLYQLEERLETVQNAERIGRMQLRERLADGQVVGLIFTHFLDRLTVVIRMDQQCDFGGFARRRLEEHPGLPGKLHKESLCAAVGSPIMKARDCQRKRARNGKASSSEFDSRGYGNKHELGLRPG